MNKKKLNSDKINDKTNVIKPMSKKILIMKKESLKSESEEVTEQSNFQILHKKYLLQ